MTVAGAKNENFTVIYTGTDGSERSCVMRTGYSGTDTVQIQAQKGSTVTVKNDDQPEQPTQSFTASLFQPPDKVLTAYTVNAGATLAFGGNSFDLRGGFATTDTAIEYDSSSPGYGIESGRVSQLGIYATGTAGSVSFTLSGTPTYTQNLGSIWGMSIPETGLSIPYTNSFSGLLHVNSETSPFVGCFVGTLTFFDNGSQTIAGTLEFTTDYGPLSGALSATGTPTIIPEPGSLLALTSGLLSLAGMMARRRR